MILVDTSVWIEVFRRRRPLDLANVVDIDDVATCLPIVQEVLQGFRDENVVGAQGRLDDRKCEHGVARGPKGCSRKRSDSFAQLARPAEPYARLLIV